MRIETKCVQSGYKPENGQPRILPIYQSTTYRYESAKHVGDLFDLAAEGHLYSRISNPTLDYVEKKIADLEGGVGALLCSTGQSAILIAILNLCSAGDHVVASSTLYGGTTNLFAVTLKKLGIQFTFVDADTPEEELQKAFLPNTKAVYGEVLANPALTVLDIEKFARLAKANGVPLIVDNTFPTPVLCRPLEFGANIVIHSTSKYMDGHAAVLGGVIVDGGNFDFTSGKFPEFTEPDPSYHGVVYTKQFPGAPYITKARVQLMRDLGAVQSPLTAFILNYGLEALHVRVERHCENALAVAKFLEKDPRVEFVNYPGLESDKYHGLAKQYMPKGTGGVLSFGLKKGKEAAVTFMDSLKLAAIVVHVADLRTCVLHPASTTHRQLTEEQLEEAGVLPGLVRLSVGLEHVEDIIADIAQALDVAEPLV